MLISSKLHKLKFESNIFLKKDSTNKLDKGSIVKTDIIYKFPDEHILLKVGEVDMNNIEKYKKCYYDYLNSRESN